MRICGFAKWFGGVVAAVLFFSPSVDAQTCHVTAADAFAAATADAQVQADSLCAANCAGGWSYQVLVVDQASSNSNCNAGGYKSSVQRYYNGTYQSPNIEIAFHAYSQVVTDCANEPQYQDIFHTLEPPATCLPSGCEYEATTGSCDELGTCIFNIAPTGLSCDPDTSPPPDPNLPTNCARNNSTGNVSCDCSVTPNAAYCQNPDVPDSGIPPHCIRDEFGNLFCVPDFNTDPNNPNVPDPNQDPTPGTLPGDDNGNGVCDPMELCADDSFRNDLLQDILDEMRGDGLNLGEDGSSKMSKVMAKLSKAKSEISSNMKKNANESGVETAHSDAGTEAGNVFSRVIMGGMACPSAASTLPNGMVFDPDVNKIIGPVRGFNSFALWILVLWSIWTGIMRMIRA